MSGADLGGGSGAEGPEAQAGPLGPREGPSPRADVPSLLPGPLPNSSASWFCSTQNKLR